MIDFDCSLTTEYAEMAHNYSLIKFWWILKKLFEKLLLINTMSRVRRVWTVIVMECIQFFITIITRLRVSMRRYKLNLSYNLTIIMYNSNSIWIFKEKFQLILSIFFIQIFEILMLKRKKWSKIDGNSNVQQILSIKLTCYVSYSIYIQLEFEGIKIYLLFLKIYHFSS